MTYEIINPSDKATIVGDLEVVRAAVLALADGQYGLEDENGESALPLFLFGGFAEWAKKNSFDLGEILVRRTAEVADALDSVALGGFEDRKDFDNARELMAPEAFAEWVKRRNDARRSSLTDFEGLAHAMAEKLRASIKAAP